MDVYVIDFLGDIWFGFVFFVLEWVVLKVCYYFIYFCGRCYIYFMVGQCEDRVKIRVYYVVNFRISL